MTSSLKNHPSPACLALIKAFEGICDGDPSTVNLDPYLDPVGIWTIGWGHAIRLNGRFLKGSEDAVLAKHLFSPGITLDEAKMLLSDDIAPVAIYLNGVLPNLTQNQFDALVSFVFNVGIGNFEVSTLLKRCREGDVDGAAREFPRWKFGTDEHGNKVVEPGLVVRRAAERNLFVSPGA